MQRVKSGKAAVKLRKLFLYRGSPFNVMQEVWIQDKHNPDAQGPHGDPLKEFAVVHVHHHAGVRRVQDVDEKKDLDVVDAINARHLAATGVHYQNDNPFFSTFIEPSGRNTLKVYPKPKDWTCSVCRQTNFSTKPACRGWRGAPCRGTRPGAAWDWKRNKHVDEGLAEILAQSEQAWKSGHYFQSGQGKYMTRVSGDQPEAGIVILGLEELMRQYGETRKKACPKCCRIQCDCENSSNDSAPSQKRQATQRKRPSGKSPPGDICQIRWILHRPSKFSS